MPKRISLPTSHPMTEVSFKLAKQMDRSNHDVMGEKCVKNDAGELSLSEEEKMKGWVEHYARVLNVPHQSHWLQFAKLSAKLNVARLLAPQVIGGPNRWTTRCVFSTMVYNSSLLFSHLKTYTNDVHDNHKALSLAIC